MEDRRHIAVMFTDIVGYTALMGSDEDKAFDMLKRNHTIHATLIKKHNGKLIKEVGDGTLASFPLASDAVRCAMDIQKEARSQKIPLKIGIHQGEMVMVGADVLGDAVNVASRLQESAEEGCISISGKVYSDVKNKAGIEAEFIEEQRFKNVEDPIKVYKVRCEEEDAEPISEQQPAKKNKLPYYIIAGLVVVIAAILIWQLLPMKDTGSGPMEVLDKSIAVLPFRNDSPDQENEYFCNGMMEDILNNLQKVEDLRVRSRTTVEQYRDNKKDVGKIANELDVTFIVEGSVQKVGDNIKITVQLIEADKDDHLWSETYVGKYTDEIFDFQINTAKKIAASLAAVITPEEEKQIDRMSTSEIKAYDFCIRAEHERLIYWRTSEKKHLKTSHNLSDKALQIDPKYPRAILSKGNTFLAEENYDSALFFAEKVIILDSENSSAYGLMGECYWFMGQDDLAIENYLKAINLPAKDDMWLWYHVALGRVYSWRKNDIIKALPYLEKGLEMEQLDLWSTYYYIGLCYIHIGDYEKARKYFTLSMDIDHMCNGNVIYYLWTFAVQGKLNEYESYTDSICSIIDCDQQCIRFLFYANCLQKEYNEAESIYGQFGEVGRIPGRLDSLYLANVYQRLNKEDEAMAMIEQLVPELKSQLRENNTWANYYFLSATLSLKGEKEEALQYLTKAVEVGLGNGYHDYILIDPTFENLHDDPEFKAIVKRAQDEKAAIRAQVQEMIESGEIDL
ncbi:adenylate/guanylate cyclase domain-containing protein [Bacteroidota bacterium]